MKLFDVEFCVIFFKVADTRRSAYAAQSLELFMNIHSFQILHDFDCANVESKKEIHMMAYIEFLIRTKKQM